jgi:hypothetical protein
LPYPPALWRSAGLGYGKPYPYKLTGCPVFSMGSSPLFMPVRRAARRHPAIPKAWVAFAPLLLASCSRAPSFDILGSFFPAWLVCLSVSILLTFLARWLLLHLHIAVVSPILVYPSLTFLFAFALWLIFFR